MKVKLNNGRTAILIPATMEQRRSERCVIIDHWPTGKEILLSFLSRLSINGKPATVAGIKRLSNADTAAIIRADLKQLIG